MAFLKKSGATARLRGLFQGCLPARLYDSELPEVVDPPLAKAIFGVAAKFIPIELDPHLSGRANKWGLGTHAHKFD